MEQQESQKQDQTTDQYSVTNRLDALDTNTVLCRRSAFARCVDWLLSWISAHSRRRIEKYYLPSLLQNVISKKMDVILRQKMQDNYIEAQTDVVAEEKQARYFVVKLR